MLLFRSGRKGMSSHSLSPNFWQSFFYFLFEVPFFNEMACFPANLGRWALRLILSYDSFQMRRSEKCNIFKCKILDTDNSGCSFTLPIQNKQL